MYLVIKLMNINTWKHILKYCILYSFSVFSVFRPMEKDYKNNLKGIKGQLKCTCFMCFFLSELMFLLLKVQRIRFFSKKIKGDKEKEFFSTGITCSRRTKRCRILLLDICLNCTSLVPLQLIHREQHLALAIRFGFRCPSYLATASFTCVVTRAESLKEEDLVASSP